jgi:hypothetical protein
VIVWLPRGTDLSRLLRLSKISLELRPLDFLPIAVIISATCFADPMIICDCFFCSSMSVDASWSTGVFGPARRWVLLVLLTRLHRSWFPSSCRAQRLFDLSFLTVRLYKCCLPPVLPGHTGFTKESKQVSRNILLRCSALTRVLLTACCSTSPLPDKVHVFVWCVASVATAELLCLLTSIG